ncbi:hypothetical protein HZF02_18065 [Pseudomonas yamanorum]|nr:hypothetical protein HZF02_18065 [Pseudomonas yamanorum]
MSTPTRESTDTELARLYAERDQLQQDLNKRDEQLHDLELRRRDELAECQATQQRLTAADEANDMLSTAYVRAGEREHELRLRVDLLEGLLLQTNELLYLIQDELGALSASAVHVMRGKVFTALKRAEGGGDDA